ncbi:MAG: hypothetical protein NWE97_03445, partial [Candidatus Bathyarchaeota archaeon]|nr:hypothetical protein [Candidatus Bathyarchaeota archaeon]
MKLHRMQLPREVIVGNETLSLLGDICKRLGFSKSAFAVTGPDTQRVAGQRVIDLLCDQEMDVDHLVVASSTMWDVKAVENRI